MTVRLIRRVGRILPLQKVCLHYIMYPMIKTHCIRGHQLEGNRTKDNHCLMCSRLRAREWAKNNPEQHNANGKKWYHGHRETSWIRWIKNAYKLTLEKFQEMVEQQNNCCAICLRPFSSNYKPCVDHDHACCPGKHSCGQCIDGLLCKTCNYALGMLENPVWAASAAKYLERRGTRANITESPRMKAARIR